MSILLPIAIFPTVRIFLNERVGVGLDLPWFSGGGAVLDVRFAVGLDWMNIWPFLLTCLSMLFILVVGRKHPDGKGNGYYRLLLVMQTGLLGMFVACDAILFFVFFEFVIIPFAFLLGNFSDNGRRTAMRFICMDTAGAQAVLLGLLAVVAMGQLPAYEQAAISSEARLGIFVMLVGGFTVRAIVPMFVGNFVPATNICSTVAGFMPSILLACGGVYGAMRFARPLLDDVSVAAWPWAMGLVGGCAICAAMFCVVVFLVEKGQAA